MAKSYNILREKMSPERRALSEERANKIIAAMSLAQLRKLKGLSQDQLAEILAIKQANISRLEKRTDIYISTLRKYVEAMGGHLELIARFPDGKIMIDQLVEIN